MNGLYILYDAQNPFCLSCREWMAGERALVPLEFVPYQARELMERFAGIEEYRAKYPLVAVGDDGAVYAGPEAFVMCLFALERQRDWAMRLAGPALLPVAANAVGLLVTHRGKVPRWLWGLPDEELEKLLSFQQETLPVK